MFMYKDYTLVWNGNPVVYSVYCHSGGVCGRVVNTSNSGSGGPGFKRRPSRCLPYIVAQQNGLSPGVKYDRPGECSAE